MFVVGGARLWTLNIGALFPIIQTTLNGQSLQSWNQQRIDRATSELARLVTGEVAGLDRQLATAEAAERHSLESAREGGTPDHQHEVYDLVGQ